MRNIKISQGTFSKQQQKSGNIHINVKHKDIVGRGMIVDVDFGKSQQEREECLGNAALIVDTFETYNKCHKRPSELLEENRELVEALKRGRDMCDMLRFPTETELTVFKRVAEALITKIENKE